MDPLSALAEPLAEAIVNLLRRLRVKVGPTGVELSLIAPAAERSLDQRLAQIDVARRSLADALSAMDALKVTAEENKRDLERVTTALAEAEAKKQDIAAEITAIKGVAALDGEAVRRGLGLPTAVDQWRERLIGAFFGVATGLVASTIFQIFITPHLRT